MGAWFLCNCV